MPHRGSKSTPQRRKSLTEKGISSTNTPERIAAGRAESQRRQSLGRASQAKSFPPDTKATFQSRPVQSFASPADLRPSSRQSQPLQSLAGPGDLQRGRTNIQRLSDSLRGIENRLQANPIVQVMDNSARFAELTAKGTNRTFSEEVEYGLSVIPVGGVARVTKGSIGLVSAAGKKVTLYTTNRQAKFLAKRGIDVTSKTKAAINVKTKALHSKMIAKLLTTKGIALTIAATSILGGVLYGYQIGFWGSGEALEGPSIVAREALHSDNLAIKEQAKADLDAAYDAAIQNELILKFPVAGGITGVMEKFKRGIPAAKVMSLLLEDDIMKFKTGMTDDEVWDLRNSQRDAMEIGIINFRNSEKVRTERILIGLREQARKESDRATIRIQQETIRLWEEYAAQQGIFEQQEREEMAQFWLDYAKRKAQLGGLGFGLL